MADEDEESRSNLFDPNHLLDYKITTRYEINQRFNSIKRFPAYQFIYSSKQNICLLNMEEIYESSRNLLSLSSHRFTYFHFHVLSGVRSILEILYRFQKNLDPDHKFENINTIFDDSCWPADTGKSAKNIYNKLLSPAAHGTHAKVFELSLKRHLKNLSEHQKNTLNGMVNNLGKEKAIKLFSIKNISVLDKECFNLMNEIYEIICAVLTKIG